MSAAAAAPVKWRSFRATPRATSGTWLAIINTAGSTCRSTGSGQYEKVVVSKKTIETKSLQIQVTKT